MPETHQPDPKRWTALIFIALAQLMVVLDATVVNIALPSAQADLGISDGNKQWVITAYTLAFGGLLLFGGRLADLWGRKNTFIVGLLGFAAASAIGGAAVNTAMLLGARALQGVFGALLAPAALSLVAVTFTDAKERAKAFGIYGAIAGAGAAVGLILGGVLTQLLNWRWALFVNIIFAIVAVIGAVMVIREPAEGRNRNRLDTPGVLLVSAGLVALVYGFTRADSDGWTAPITLGLFAASAVLLAAFVFVESRVAAPLLPLRVVTNRNRGGVYLSLGLAIIGMFGLFLFLTYYLQLVMGYSAIKSGLAFLPMIGGMIVGSTQIGTRLMLRVRPRLLMAPGFLLAAVGMAILAQIKVDSSYPTVLLPGLILMGLGMGTAFMPAMSLATHGVRPEDAGVASAMVNTSQQVGGSIGTALLNTLATSASATWVSSHLTSKADLKNRVFVNTSMVHGYSVAIYWATAILLLSSVLAFVLVDAGVQSGPERVDGDKSVDEDFAVPVIAH
ncbi:MFS transporter [Actinacidiphila bryophytorum]|jgi:EmrB/QacA subfamily drug resistance transporter|uniref:MFS transporter n=1 Tax=Actinacidiphila bryophytorum TaxID=1436133 RepID=UPI002176B8AB|nr:MFS transporter [Actinacidiphila bryophytorum]UWE08032.1 DHA2 family efflux MFS transporter permease subunit [Actinacidiphila bryophytorum]